MDDLVRFIEVVFPDIEQIKWRTFWYVCGTDVEKGDTVIAPLGIDNLLREGKVIRIKETSIKHAPFPMDGIKLIREVIKNV